MISINAAVVEKILDLTCWKLLDSSYYLEIESLKMYVSSYIFSKCICTLWMLEAIINFVFPSDFVSMSSQYNFCIWICFIGGISVVYSMWWTMIPFSSGKQCLYKKNKENWALRHYPEATKINLYIFLRRNRAFIGIVETL
jgi:hypothetical protein